MEDQRPEPGFLIDDQHYPLPRLEDIDLDEERLLYLYADTVLQDFAPPHPEMEANAKRAYEIAQAQKIRNPDFKRALAHIAYRRGHPDVDNETIQAAIGKVSALEVDLAMLRSESDRPPAPSSQNEPEKPSDSSNRSRASDSGSPTESDSDPADENPEPTGTSESGTSSRLSLTKTSVA